MGLLDVLLKRKPKKELGAQFKVISGYSPAFTTYQGGLYEMANVRAAIDTFASNCAKLKAEVRGPKQTELAAILQTRPNPVMDGFKFLYRIATILMVDNNVIIVPLYDYRGRINGFFPMRTQSCEIVESQGILYLRYRFSNGQCAVIELDRIGLMTRLQYKDDVFGESNTAIDPILQVVHAQQEGMISGLKNSARIRYIAKIGNVLSPELIRKERENWAEENLSRANQSGLIVFDNKFTSLEQVKNDQWVIDAEQQKLIDDSINTYFGTNMKILQSNYTDEEFAAYYASRIEPFAIQLSLVLTNMVFSWADIKAGCEIVLTPKRFDQMRNDTKLQMSTQLFDRGVFSINDVMDMYNLPHVENGDKRYIRKEYTEISMLDDINRLAIKSGEESGND